MYTDVMVDIETTGTTPDRSGILQIAAVKFNLAERTVCSEFFDRCMMLPNFRHWSEGTRSWWQKQKREVLRDIMQRGEDPQLVMQSFCEWAYPMQSLRFWSKPSHFDYPFVSSYIEDFGCLNPFSYRETTDLNSFLRGLYFPQPPLELNVDPVGDAHNALNDALWQIKVLFTHLEEVNR